GFDHRERDPVLNRPARILILQFQEKVARAGVELRDLHEWCVADQRKDRRRLVMRNRRRWGRLNHSQKATRSSARLCATTPTGCPQEIAARLESGLRRSSRRNADRRPYTPRLSESTKAADRQTA